MKTVRSGLPKHWATPIERHSPTPTLLVAYSWGADRLRAGVDGLVGLAGHGSALPMATVIAGCGLMAYLTHRTLVDAGQV